MTLTAIILAAARATSVTNPGLGFALKCLLPTALPMRTLIIPRAITFDLTSSVLAEERGTLRQPRA